LLCLQEKLVRLLLVRHAESAGNAAGIIQGRADFPLSPRGERQASLLAGYLAKHVSFGSLYASPLSRADATAKAIAALTGVPVRPLAAAMEYDYGEANGMAYRLALETYGDGRGSAALLRIPGEEGRERFHERVCTGLWALEDEHSDETVVVVSHIGPIAAFCSAALGLPDGSRAPIAIHNASITTIDVRERRASFHGINDTCHLAGT
jgi:broad specificity phosphatase PhoE